MNATEIDRLVRRLVLDPHDEDALAYAHQVSRDDPKGYAMLLECIGHETQDTMYACHWLSQAADVWTRALGEAHRAARLLMEAVDRDPAQRAPADRLAQLYREKGDCRALLALLERRAKALAPLAPTDPDLQHELALVHEELGRIWSESLGQPAKALEHFRRSVELDPSGAFAIFSAREIHKSFGQLREALPLFDAELALTPDAPRRISLLRDEAEVRRAVGDLAGATRALWRARQLDEADPGLRFDHASSIVRRARGGEAIPEDERRLACDLLITLAESYGGDLGLAYVGAALDLVPGDDRAFEFFVRTVRGGSREGAQADVNDRALAYLRASPAGARTEEAREALAGHVRLLEAQRRWDELIALWTRQVAAERDPARQAALEKKIATVHEMERQDFLAAAEAWLRISERDPDEGRAVVTAAKLFEQGGRPDRAAELLAEHTARLEVPDEEKTERWERLTELLELRLEQERDEEEVSNLTRKLAEVLSQKLDRGDEALAVLTELADRGDAACRTAYAAVGDRLGWLGIVGLKLAEWWEAADAGPERTRHLREAFERLAQAGRAKEAVSVGVLLVNEGERDLAQLLEECAVHAEDDAALTVARAAISATKG